MPEDTTVEKPRPGRKPIITPQRKQLILDFIHEFRRVKGVSPKIEEITLGMGYRRGSEGTAHTIINQLIEEGWLRKALPGARAILPVYPADKVYCPITEPDLLRIKKQQKNLVILRRL